MKPSPLSPEQDRFFEEQGYLVVEDLLPQKWVEEIRRDLEGIHERMAEAIPEGVHVSWEHEVDPSLGADPRVSPKDQRKIKQLMHAELVSPALNRLVRSPYVLDIVEALIGPEISLYHCKLLMKPARGGTTTPWHQDYAYWVQEENKPLMVNCMVQIDDSTLENGCLQVVPGSHKQGLLHHKRQGTVFGLFLPGYFEPREDAVPIPLRAGSAVFFNSLIIHGSGPNESDQDRRAVTIAYNVTENGRGQTREVLRGIRLGSNS